MVKHQRQRASGDPIYDSVRQAARRLTIGVPLLLSLIDSGVIPTQSFNGRHKIEAPSNWWTLLLSSGGSGKVSNGPGTASFYG